LLGLVPYTVNGEMRFYWVIDEKCMSRSEVDSLNREFMALLQNHVQQADGDSSEVSRMPAAVAGRRS
jgi:hypothetical protein